MERVHPGTVPERGWARCHAVPPGGRRVRCESAHERCSCTDCETSTSGLNALAPTIWVKHRALASHGLAGGTGAGAGGPRRRSAAGGVIVNGTTGAENSTVYGTSPEIPVASNCESGTVANCSSGAPRSPGHKSMVSLTPPGAFGLHTHQPISGQLLGATPVW